MMDLLIPLSQFDVAGHFGINTNILETNLVNLAVVISVLVYFGRGVCAD
jgi:F-type H+-transporting ATPase subunit b